LLQVSFQEKECASNFLNEIILHVQSVLII